MPIPNKYRLVLMLAVFALAKCWANGDELSVVPVVRELDKCVQADFLVSGRVLGTGCAQCSYVRYYVTKNNIEFHVLWSEPDFTVSEYPGRADSLAGSHNRQSGSAQLFELWSGLRTENSDSKPSQFTLKKLSYNAGESARTPLDFDRWKQRSLMGEVSNSEVEYSKSKSGLPLLVLDNGLLQTAKWKNPHSQSTHTAEYTFGDNGKLASIKTHVPGRAYEVGISDYERSLAISRGIDSTNNSEESMSLIHLLGNRTATVKFHQYVLENQRNTLPTTISVNVQETSVSNRVKMVRSAHCLSVKTVEHTFSPLTSADDKRFSSLPKTLRKELSIHWKTGFETAAANEFLSRLRKISTSASRQEDRVASLSIQLTAAVLSKSEKNSVELTDQWADEVLRSQMRPYYAEMAMQLLKRVQWSGTAEMFSRIQKLIVERATEVVESDLLDGSLNCRATTKMPYTILRLACVDETFQLIPSNNPEASLRRAFLAASLIPSLRKELEWDKAKETYAAFDITQMKKNMTVGKLEKLSDEVYEQAIRSVKQLSKSQQKDWHIDFLKLKSWVQK